MDMAFQITAESVENLGVAGKPLCSLAKGNKSLRTRGENGIQ